ncbi:MAG TPA: ABC transporter permease subunit [Candidatus Binataceae bacterium]|nr:ABC transporter permease subunit [Candidatus Binataceae bacterium]
MTISRQHVAAMAHLDLAEVLRSRWLGFLIALYGALAAMFVLVGLRESDVLGFTGMGRVLLSMCNALVLLIPLLALTGSGQVVNRAREDGTLELLLSHPISRAEYFAAVSIVRYGVLLMPLVVLMVALGIYGRVAFGEAMPWGFVARSVAVSASLGWAFVAIALGVSVAVRSQAKAMVYLLVIWVVAVALLDFALIGMMLQWRLNAQSVFILACINPVETARMALLSSADVSLSALGPVGFFVANRIGTHWLFALGVAWPIIVGTASWFAAWRYFAQGDVV